MSDRSRTLAATLLGGLLVLGALAVPASATTTTTRFASPSGHGSGCSKPDPCGIVTAINHAPAGSHVVIEPGRYGTAKHPVTALLEDFNPALVIHGLVGKPLPVIRSNQLAGAISLSQGSTLSHVDVISSSTSAAVRIVDSNADHLAVFDTGAGGVGCAIIGNLTDSLCAATGPQNASFRPSVGLQIDNNESANTLAVTGVTAVAPQTGTGISVTTATASAFTLNATNDIFLGGNVGIAVVAPDQAALTVNAESTDFDNDSVESIDSGSAALIQDASDTQAAPKFVDPGARDYRERARSATVDAGSSAVVTPGETDLAGLPRTVGKAPDMGAFEFAAKPAVGKLEVTERTSHHVRLQFVIHTGGLATTLVIRRTRRHHTVTDSMPISASPTKKPSAIVLRKLTPRSTYQVEFVVTNALGSGPSKRTSVTTK